MKNNLTDKTADLLMICGALHDIAEISREENISRHVKTVQQKLEKIVFETMPPQLSSVLNLKL